MSTHLYAKKDGWVLNLLSIVIVVVPGAIPRCILLRGGNSLTYSTPTVIIMHSIVSFLVNNSIPIFQTAYRCVLYVISVYLSISVRRRLRWWCVSNCKTTVYNIITIIIMIAIYNNNKKKTCTLLNTISKYKRIFCDSCSTI